jgi:hypothetical protein
MSMNPSIEANFETTETLVRFYILLVHQLDFVLPEPQSKSLSQEDVAAQVTATWDNLQGVLSSNSVVKDKLEAEYGNVRALRDALTAKSGDQTAQMTEARALRMAFQHKMMALSDLVALLRTRG